MPKTSKILAPGKLLILNNTPTTIKIAEIIPIIIVTFFIFCNFNYRVNFWVSIFVLMLPTFTSFKSFSGVTSIVNLGNSIAVLEAKIIIDSFLTMLSSLSKNSKALLRTISLYFYVSQGMIVLNYFYKL